VSALGRASAEQGCLEVFGGRERPKSRAVWRQSQQSRGVFEAEIVRNRDAVRRNGPN
jgi:hypothetical protein